MVKAQPEPQPEPEQPPKKSSGGGSFTAGLFTLISLLFIRRKRVYLH